MTTFKRTVAWVIITALTAFGAAFAQEQQPETRTIQIEGEEVAPLGEIQVGEAQPYDASETQTVEVEVQTGAIAFTATVPGDQNPNVDLVGPNGYYQRFEIGSDEVVIDGLLPGVYSISATDNGLQVAHTLVEVPAGQAISVDFSLQELAAFEEGVFQQEAQTAFPDNAYQADEPVAIEDAEFGEVSVQTENEDTRFVLTGPDDYSREFTGSFTASDLAPGVYVIAGTREGDFQVEGLTGTQIATSAVEVSVSQAVTFVPVYDIVGTETEEVETEVEEVEDVAGGGAAEEEQQQDAEEQPVEEQPADEDVEDEAGEGPIEEPVEEAVDPDADEEDAQEEEQQ